MDLREYLFRHHLKISEFSKKIDHERTYINAIVTGKKIPGKKLAKMIEKITNGEVTVAELLKEKK